jgi:hypothetical protein
MIALYLLSALIMFILEYFVLLRVYKRSKTLEKISLIVAPIMIVIAIMITNFIQTLLLNQRREPINPLLLFIVLVLLELPLSLYGYELTPDASIPERLVVAGSVGVVVVLIAQGILSI